MLKNTLYILFLYIFLMIINSQNEPNNPPKVVLSKEELQTLTLLRQEKNKNVNFEQVLGAHKCGHCHNRAFEVWKETPHFTTYSELPKYEHAKRIKKNLNIRGSIKRNELCRNCHFTQQKTSKGVEIISGVSCESCHGPAQNWIDTHNDYGTESKETESPAQEEERRKRSIAKGLKSPFDIYQLAEACYKCHTVPNEVLVNKGGHKAGSNFDLVTWMEGFMRHNFMRGRHGVNEESSQPRLRVMFITGIVLDLEYALRGLAKSKEKGEYRYKMQQRAENAYKKIVAICRLKPIKELTAIIFLLRNINLSGKNASQILFAADFLALKNKLFGKNCDGSDLQVLDKYLPQKSQYLWKASPREK